MSAQRASKLELSKKLHLLKKRRQSFHDLLTGMVVNSLVSGDHNAGILGQPLNLFLHIACMMCAPIVTPVRTCINFFVRISTHDNISN